MKKNKYNISAFEIALSAVSCAVATLFLSLGMLNNYLLATGYIVACFALMLPLAKGFIWGNVLAFFATTGLTFLFGAAAVPWKMLPFVLIFGLHPLVNFLQLRFGWKPYAALAAKAVWFDAALYLVWRFTFGMVTSFPLLDEYIVPAVLLGGTVFFVFYDRLIFRCQAVVDRLVARIKRK